LSTRPPVVPEVVACSRKSEQRDPDAVIEQALARDHRLQAFGHLRSAEHAEDRHRVGRGNQRAENEAVAERNRRLHEHENAEHAGRYREGGEKDPHGRERKNGPFADTQLVHVDIERACKQQKAEKDVEQQRPEVCLLERVADQCREPDGRERVFY
jgi:hypothetical protein